MINKYAINKFLNLKYNFLNSHHKKKGIIIKGDGSWVFNQIVRELNRLFFYMNLNIINKNHLYYSKQNFVFFLSRYELMRDFNKFDHKKGFAYYHGHPKYDNKWKSHIEFIKKNKNQIDRIMVSNSEIEELILENNFQRHKLFKIPISVDYSLFNSRFELEQNELRSRFNIPKNSFIIGSFQKDGEGWGRGLKPKLIKGPDIFVKTMIKLKDKIDNLYILLSGPSRGYVKKELSKNNIPFKHINLKNYKQTPLLYCLIDLYFIASREEGGPRSLLESFSSNIPVVSTNVGQVKDLLINNINGYKSESFDTDELSELILNTYNKIMNNEINQIINNANKTAYENSYLSQTDLWKHFFEEYNEL
tara:strand:- start:10 stop:1095 length:1086 start_codon:yes stop_codon:yes gene_type:complete